jgi:LysM repeat protein
MGTNVRSEVFGMNKRNSKKRVRLVNKRRFVTVVVTFLMIIMASVSVIGSAISEEVPVQYTSLIVQRGDTLWSIASEYGPGNMDIREYINEIEKVNVIENSFLAEGQELRLPHLD